MCRQAISKILCGLAVLAAGAIAGTGADAATGPRFYADIGYAPTFIGHQGDMLQAVTVGGGVALNRYLAVEADLGAGVGSTRLKVSKEFDEDVEGKLDYTYGVYAVGRWPVSKSFDIFLRAGWMKARFTEDLEGYKYRQGHAGAAVGLGVRYFPHDGSNGITADVTHYGFNTKGNGLNQVRLAYTRRF